MEISWAAIVSGRWTNITIQSRKDLKWCTWGENLGFIVKHFQFQCVFRIVDFKDWRAQSPEMTVLLPYWIVTLP